MSELDDTGGGADADYVRPTPFEVATCWLHGLLPPAEPPAATMSPRDALARAIRPALVNGPCYVTFSGGRDSSVVLAVATHVARTEGLPDPIPVTRVYPEHPESDEFTWQQLVVDHLGVKEWLRLEVAEGEHDLLGPVATRSLAGRGLLWPPALHVQDAVFARLCPGGTVLTGEGGDEVLGARRATPLYLIRRRRLSRQLLGWTARSVAPAGLRRALLRAEFRRATPDLQPWLTPQAARRHAELLARDAAAEPLRYDRATWWTSRKRVWAAIDHNQGLVAADHGVRAVNPLLDPGFLAALGRAGGRWGFAGRTAVMKRVFGDLLPAEVLSRTSKARFNAAYSGPASREFARMWDGSGVDPQLVDAQRLREAWLSDQPTMRTALLLHSAWLAANSRTVTQ